MSSVLLDIHQKKHAYVGVYIGKKYTIENQNSGICANHGDEVCVSCDEGFTLQAGHCVSVKFLDSSE